MIAAIYGTTGELIKLAPVLTRLRDLGQPALTLCTGQQIRQIPAMLDDFGLPQPDFWLGRGHRGSDLERPREIPRWFAETSARFLRLRGQIRRRLLSGPERPLVVVHGDTFTTLIGAAMGRTLGVPVAHLEAGLRSGTWRDPFPEELNRRGVTRLATIHFAPGDTAVRNLRDARAAGPVVNTHGNTVHDNLAAIAPGLPPGFEHLGDEPFGLVSLHRFELLERRRELRAIVEMLHEASRTLRLLFVDYPTTGAAIDAAGLSHLFDDRFVRVPRQRYHGFLSLLKASELVVTDSGGIQEECGFLDHPCVVHRAVTEREDGLGRSVVLSGGDLEVVRRFLERPPRPEARPPSSGAGSPSDIVVDWLATHRFIRLPSADVDASQRGLEQAPPAVERPPR